MHSETDADLAQPVQQFEAYPVVVVVAAVDAVAVAEGVACDEGVVYVVVVAVIVAGPAESSQFVMPVPER